MKNQELFTLYQGLKNLNLTGIKLNFAIIKNMKLLEAEIESIQKALKSDEKFEEFEKKRVELLDKYGLKKNGNFVSENNQVVLKDAEGFDKEFSVIQEQYADIISSRAQQLKEYSELLQQENDIQLKKIDISWMPEDIETKDMNILYPLIEE